MRTRCSILVTFSTRTRDIGFEVVEIYDRQKSTDLILTINYGVGSAANSLNKSTGCDSVWLMAEVQWSTALLIAILLINGLFVVTLAFWPKGILNTQSFQVIFCFFSSKNYKSIIKIMPLWASRLFPVLMNYSQGTVCLAMFHPKTIQNPIVSICL